MLLAAVAVHAQNDAITRFFNQYAEDERFTVVYVSPKMFQLVAKIDTDDPDWQQLREIVKDLGGIRVLTGDSIAGGLDLYKEALGRVPKEGVRRIAHCARRQRTRAHLGQRHGQYHRRIVVVGGRSRRIYPVEHYRKDRPRQNLGLIENTRHRRCGASR